MQGCPFTAVLALLKETLVSKYKWLSRQHCQTAIAISHGFDPW